MPKHCLEMLKWWINPAGAGRGWRPDRGSMDGHLLICFGMVSLIGVQSAWWPLAVVCIFFVPSFIFDTILSVVQWDQLTPPYRLVPGAGRSSWSARKFTHVCICVSRRKFMIELSKRQIIYQTLVILRYSIAIWLTRISKFSLGEQIVVVRRSKGYHRPISSCVFWILPIWMELGRIGFVCT